MNSTDLAKSDVTLYKPVIICSIPCGYLIALALLLWEQPTTLPV
jgi:hypothetical protein